RRVVLIVDEAQNLSFETLEQVHLLTNLETATTKLLQIILIGQEELRALLEQPDLRQLAQRITGRYHLSPLGADESAGYVKHRMRVAGATAEAFTPGALREIYRLSKGIPRVINVVSDRALLGAFTREEHRVGTSYIREAASEVYGRPIPAPWLRWATAGAVAAALALVAFGAWSVFGRNDAKTAAAKTPVIAPASNAAPAPNRGRGCEQATAQGLECLFQKGSWAQLRTLNRPAILTLTDDVGGTHQVLLIALTDEAATIELGGKPQDLPIATISRYWFGDFLLLWRPPLAVVKSLGPGMRGAEVRWLRDNLRAAQGLPEARPVNDFYDEELTQLVQDFQRTHRLNADGVAGVQTQIVLDTVLNPSGSPTLGGTPVRTGG
ncbi:MAG: peptidoglycan-binding protein, partial [Proteobacteria bacterium]|nr:peptidoglycan-binding protein [Pseudomonadota bacterium]